MKLINSFSDGRRPQILAIDDDDFSLAILSNMLNEEGYDILTCGSAAEGWKVLSAIVPSAILLDVNMPGEDGFTTARKLREDPRFAYTAIIFITSKDSQENIVEGFSAGGDEYVTKPYCREVLSARIGTHVRFRQAVQALRREHDRMSRELKLAGALQLSVMSLKPFDRPGMQARSVFRPSTEVGGDFCDVIDDGSGGVWAYLGDVAGHGAGPALVASALHALIPDIVETSGRLGPAAVCNALHAHFHALIPHDELYATFFLAHISQDGTQIEALSCGHPQPYVRDAGGTDISSVLCGRGGIPIGFALGGEIPYADTDAVHVQLQPGATVIIVSDGLTEARNIMTEEQCPSERVAELAGRLCAMDVLDPGMMISALEAEGYAPGRDDCTILALRFIAPGKVLFDCRIPATLEEVSDFAAALEKTVLGRGWSGEAALRARLVAVEHMVNSVKHGRLAPEAVIRAHISLQGAALRLYFEDSGMAWEYPARMPVLENIPIANERGRGLALIAELAADSGRSRRGLLNAASFMVQEQGGSDE